MTSTPQRRQVSQVSQASLRFATVVVWHVSFAVVSALAIVFVAASHAPWWVYLSIAIQIVAYAGFMSTGLRTGSPALMRCYLPFAWGSSVAVAFGEPNGLVTLFAVFPHTVAILQRRWQQIVAVSALTVACSAGVVVNDRGDGAGHVVSQLALTIGLPLVMSTAVGLVTGMLIAETDRRGRLIADLEATRTELAAANHEAGVLAERARMAREIHDTLAQGFTSLLMLVQAAEADLDRMPDDDGAGAAVRRRLETAARTARENLAEARALVAAQGPEGLGGVGPADLHDTLGRMTAGIGEELDVAAEFRIAGKPHALPAATQVVLVRSAQEALANVRKHAHAGHVDVELAYRERTVELAVRDDGLGFAADAQAHNGGYGLRGMRERLRQADGRVAVLSEPGAGTTVRVEVPL